MKLLGSLILLYVLTPSANAQNSLTKVLVIDTISIDKHNPIELYENLYSFYNYKTAIAPEPNSDSGTLLVNYLKTYRTTKGDSLNINLPIDQKGGFICLEHIEYLPDTIHINRINLLWCSLRDSASVCSHYYKYANGKLIEKIPIHKLSNKRVELIHDRTELTINGVRHVVKLNSNKIESNNNEVTVNVNCGFASKKDEDIFEKYRSSKNNARIYHYTKVSYSKHTYFIRNYYGSISFVH